MNKQAILIQQRANRLNISINKLCLLADVSRGWFEIFKQRLPKSMETYNKIIEILDNMENATEMEERTDLENWMQK